MKQIRLLRALGITAGVSFVPLTAFAAHESKIFSQKGSFTCTAVGSLIAFVPGYPGYILLKEAKGDWDELRCMSENKALFRKQFVLGLKTTIGTSGVALSGAILLGTYGLLFLMNKCESDSESTA